MGGFASWTTMQSSSLLIVFRVSLWVFIITVRSTLPTLGDYFISLLVCQFDWRFIDRSLRSYVINREVWFTSLSCTLVQIAYDKLWEGKPERSWWVCSHLTNHNVPTLLLMYSSLSFLPSSIPVSAPTLPWHPWAFDNSKTLVLTLSLTEKHILFGFKWCRSSLFYEQLITAYYERLHYLTVLKNIMLVRSKNIILSVQVFYSFNNKENLLFWKWRVCHLKCSVLIILTETGA